jgi:hypothetical protein
MPRCDTAAVPGGLVLHRLVAVPVNVAVSAPLVVGCGSVFAAQTVLLRSLCWWQPCRRRG